MVDLRFRKSLVVLATVGVVVLGATLAYGSPPDRFEPNNTPRQAAELAQGHYSDLVADGWDYYVFDLEQTAVVVAVATPDAGALALVMTKGVGQVVAISATNGGPQAISATLAAGRYTLIVHNSEHAPPITYSLQLAVGEQAQGTTVRTSYAASFYGYRYSSRVLAAVMVAHGLFDEHALIFAASTFDNGDRYLNRRELTTGAQSFLTRVPQPPAHNSAPLFENERNVEVFAKGISTSASFAANDLEGDLLSYSVDPLPAGASFDSSTGVLTWMPGSDQPLNNPVIVSVSDGRTSTQMRVNLVAGAMPWTIDLAPGLTGQIAWVNLPIETTALTRAMDVGVTIVARGDGTYAVRLNGRESTESTLSDDGSFSVEHRTEWSTQSLSGHIEYAREPGVAPFNLTVTGYRETELRRTRTFDHWRETSTLEPGYYVTYFGMPLRADR